MIGNNRFDNENRYTGRQKREMEYYEEYVKLLDFQEVSFDPIDGKHSRPWNPYWYVYDLAREYFSIERKKLLDFGCGCGTTSLRFAKIGYEVSGFDISNSSIKVANTLAKKYGFEKQIELTQQTAETLSYPSDQFDIIVGFDILHHVDIEAAISECKRVLKKNGVAIFKEPVESPVLDDLRNTNFVKYFVPKEKNYTPGKHITQDERKLNSEDLIIIKKIFSGVKEEKFTFLSRFDIFFRRFYGKKASPLEMIDYVIFKYIPYMKKFGSDAVFILNKV